LVVTMNQFPNIIAQPRRCVLSTLSDFARRSLDKRSTVDLLAMQRLPPKERVDCLHDTLKVGLARCAIRLSEMPFGFCNAPSIKRVTSAYIYNFRQLMEYEYRCGVQGIYDDGFTDVTTSIFNQHRGTMLDVAKGVFEFYEDLEFLFGKDVELADMREDLPLIRDIEQSLDEFFTTRLTLRLLISHVNNLNKLNSLAAKEMVGVVNTNTQPIMILSRAFVAARFMCMRDFKMAPDMKINGIPHDEYIRHDAATQQHFAYVHTHLFYIFLELLKNAARACIERAQLDVDGDIGGLTARSQKKGNAMPKIPEINVIVPEGQVMWDQERSIKLADQGTGMNRIVLSKAFCYFYSSVKARPQVADEVSDFDRSVPLAGFGFGLPISRVMARYFSGDIDLNSIPGKGTDVYVYL